MAQANPSLVHIIREPETTDGDRAPLLLLLHGFGGNEENLMKFAPALDGRFFIVSVRGPFPLDQESNCWFHVEFRPEGNVVVPEEAESSRLSLLRLLDEMAATHPVDTDRVYLMGFSQGAIMSLNVALTHPERVAGVVAMSGRLMPEVLPLAAPAEALRTLPVLIVHGVHDEVLPVAHAVTAAEELAELGVDVTYQEYSMGHQITSESLAGIGLWLSSQLDLRRAASIELSREAI